MSISRGLKRMILPEPLRAISAIVPPQQLRDRSNQFGAQTFFPSSPAGAVVVVPSPLLHAEPAADADDLAGDPAAVVGGEQRHHRRNVARLAEAAQRIELHE